MQPKLVEAGVLPVTLHQLYMRTDLNYLPSVHDHNAIGALYRREPMCDNQGGTVLHQVFQSILHSAL
jgi:hypothetical protein